MSTIKTRLKEFKLSGIYNSYEERIKYATDKSPDFRTFNLNDSRKVLT